MEGRNFQHNSGEETHNEPNDENHHRRSWGSNFRSYSPAAEERMRQRALDADRNVSPEEIQPNQEQIEEHETDEFTNIINEIRDRREFIEPPTQEGDNEFKKTIKDALFKKKYEIQGQDADRIKSFREEKERLHGAAYSPLRQTIYWRKAKKSYEHAWESLRNLAKERNIWDENDEHEFLKETGRKGDQELYESLRKSQRVAINSLLTGGMYGAGYALILPWKGFELALKKLLPYFLEDREVTQNMLEAIFGKEDKKKEKKKTEKKDDKQNQTKEHETKLAIKQVEIEYIKGLKDNIIERGIQDSLTEQEYAALTAQRRNELIESVGKKEYRNVWRKMRLHWIQEDAWTLGSEKEFRDEIKDRISSNLQLRDLLTQEELNTLKKTRKEKTSLERNFASHPDREDLRAEIREAENKIEEINKIKKSREQECMWPHYKKGKRKGGQDAESFVLEEDDDDEDQDDTI